MKWYQTAILTPTFNNSCTRSKSAGSKFRNLYKPWINNKKLIIKTCCYIITASAASCPCLVNRSETRPLQRSEVADHAGRRPCGRSSDRWEVICLIKTDLPPAPGAPQRAPFLGHSHHKQRRLSGRETSVTERRRRRSWRRTTSRSNSYFSTAPP